MTEIYRTTEDYIRLEEQIYDNYPEIQIAPCSAKHHLNIKGGLIKHLQHVKENAKNYFPENKRLIFLASIHDIGKARVYQIDDNGNITYIKPECDHILHTITMLAELGIVLDNEELNALQWHHGGWSNFKGNLTPLAAKLHFCDLLATTEEDEV